MSDKRQLIVIDVETTGLDVTRHVPIEVAAINVDTSEVITFVPYLDPNDLANADPEALQINRYFERGVYKLMLSQAETARQYTRLWDMLRGNSFSGANPRFDHTMLLNAPHGHGLNLPLDHWHHRLPDVCSYVGGALGLYPAALPGLADCCELLGVVNECEHSALSDAKAAVECFRQSVRKHNAWPNDGARA
jgi:DNA polymerase III subunit epsilon